MKSTLNRLLPCIILLSIASIAGQCASQYPRTFETFPLNVELFRLVNDHHAPWFDSVLTAFAPFYWVIPLLAVVFLNVKGNRRALQVAVIAVLIETVFVHVFKQTLATPRPGASLPDVHLLVNRMKGSFPSGDVALCAAITFALMRFRPRWVFVALCFYTVFVAYERMYVGVHFPLDVLGGAVIGGLSGYAASRFWSKPRGSSA